MSVTTQLNKITQFSGQIPDRKKMDKDTFANSIPPYLNYFNNDFVPDSQTFTGNMNNIADEVNSTTAHIDNVKSQIDTIADRNFDLDKFQGDWDSSKNYTHPCMVKYNDLLWMSLQDSTGKQPDTSPDYWFRLDKYYYQYINADYTAKRYDYLLIDTTDSSINITLPANSTSFDEVFFLDVKGNFNNNNLVVKLGNTTDTIMGKAEDMAVSTKNINFGLIYYSGDWRII